LFLYQSWSNVLSLCCVFPSSHFLGFPSNFNLSSRLDSHDAHRNLYDVSITIPSGIVV
jgi:hypothetical protein